MNDDYKRGDIFKIISDREKKITPEKIVEQGNAFEHFVKSDGWKFLTEWINTQLEYKRALLESYNAKSIEEINDIRTSIMVYKLILNKPYEFIKMKNDIVEERNKRSE